MPENGSVHNLHLLLQRLADAQLDFVVIGGYAGVLHGSAYLTDNLDICAPPSRENVAKIKMALCDVHPVLRLTAKKIPWQEDSSGATPADYHHLETDEGLLNRWSHVPGIGDYDCVRSAAMNVTLFGRSYRFISLADLIAAKEAVGREKDLLAAKELRAIAAKRAQN